MYYERKRRHNYVDFIQFLSLLSSPNQSLLSFWQERKSCRLRDSFSGKLELTRNGDMIKHRLLLFVKLKTWQMMLTTDLLQILIYLLPFLTENLFKLWGDAKTMLFDLLKNFKRFTAWRKVTGVPALALSSSYSRDFRKISRFKS